MRAADETRLNPGGSCERMGSTFLTVRGRPHGRMIGVVNFKNLSRHREAKTMDEYAEGYRDGRDPDCPTPSGNRDPRYVHSFRVGRAELAGKPIPAETSRRKVKEIETLLSENDPGF